VTGFIDNLLAVAAGGAVLLAIALGPRPVRRDLARR
jgi:hypothetical protein